MDAPPLMRWEQLAVGEPLRPFTMAFTEADADTYRAALDDHAVTTVAGRCVAPPTMMFFAMLHAIDATWAPPDGIVHAEQHFVLHAPLVVPANLAVSGNLRDLRVRRGRRFLTVVCHVNDVERGPVADGEVVLLHPDRDPSATLEPPTAARARQPLQEPLQGPASGDDRVAPVSLTVTDAVIRTYLRVSGDQNPIHVDDVAARRQGYDRRIAHGMIAGGLVSRMLTEAIGPRWLEAGRFSLRFIAPVYPDQRITARSTRDASSDGYDVTAADQTGRPVLIGRAALGAATTTLTD